MDQQDLPASLTDMTLRSTDQGLPPIPGKQRAADQPADGNRQPGDRQLDYNEANGPGGVCAAAPVADPALTASPLAAPLIPDQPMPPGAPASLAAIMAAGSPVDAPGAGLSTPSTGLSTGATGFPGIEGSSERVGQPPAPPPPPQQASPKPGEDVRDPMASLKRPGRSHPGKPRTPMAIAEFAGMWHNAAYTNAQIAKRYRCGERTITDWRLEFGLPTRPEALKDQATVNGLAASAAGMVAAGTEAAKVTQAMATAPGPAAVEGQVFGHPNLTAKQMDPLQDEVIAAALRDIQSEGMIMSTHSDLKALHRKLARLAVLVATRAPRHTWDSLLFTVESLARAALRARQVEAMIPEGENDPVQLRKEAAGQMMQELKSVLTPEEQQVLARVMKAGVDRLMAKGGDAAQVTAGIDVVAGGSEA